jgi:hypothetical protein
MPFANAPLPPRLDRANKRGGCTGAWVVALVEAAAPLNCRSFCMTARATRPGAESNEAAGDGDGDGASLAAEGLSRSAPSFANSV